MIELYRNKVTGIYLLIEDRDGTYVRTEFNNEIDAKKGFKRAKINRNNRERNEVLRELTGTSAACARRDMGL
jgi:hypothetical protein